MTMEYEFPECGIDCEVQEDTKQFNCPCCNRLLGVDVDAEFVDGQWRDLTHLYLVKP